VTALVYIEYISRSCRSWAAIDELVRELDGARGPARDVTGALYADLGREIR
jgi:hypothetical protein